MIKKAKDKAQEISDVLKRKGTEADWIVVDIPKKNIIFTKSKKRIIKEKTNQNVLLERDPTKILTESGDVQLLVDVENSILSMIQHANNFVPNVYCSQSALDLLISEGIIEP